MAGLLLVATAPLVAHWNVENEVISDGSNTVYSSSTSGTTRTHTYNSLDANTILDIGFEFRNGGASGTLATSTGNCSPANLILGSTTCSGGAQTYDLVVDADHLRSNATTTTGATASATYKLDQSGSNPETWTVQAVYSNTKPYRHSISYSKNGTPYSTSSPDYSVSIPVDNPNLPTSYEDFKICFRDGTRGATPGDAAEATYSLTEEDGYTTTNTSIESCVDFGDIAAEDGEWINASLTDFDDLVASIAVTFDA